MPINSKSFAVTVCTGKMSSANNSGSTDATSSPRLDSESRGSSVSTELREEYEDLLRYAVVVPVSQVQDAKMASRGHASGGADLSTSRVQPEPVPLSVRLQPPKPHPSPLRPEGIELAGQDCF